LNSYPGKGFYISDMNFKQKIRVCLLFNKLSAQKKIIYDSFIESLGTNVNVNLFIYNNDFCQFQTLIQNHIEEYSHFVIIPHFIEKEEEAFALINSIPKGKVILVDKKPSQILCHQGAVYENFEKDIYGILFNNQALIRKYNISGR